MLFRSFIRTILHIGVHRDDHIPDRCFETLVHGSAFATLTARYTFSPTLDARAAYGRTVGNPWMGPLYSTYMSNTAAFTAAGVSLQTLWDTLKLEKSDTLEAGVDWQLGSWTLAPTVYYSKLRDKQITAYDPAVKVSYLQKIGRAHV